MNAPLFKGDRVQYTDGRMGTVYQDSDQFWVTASVEFDDDRGCIIQKDKGDLIVTERAVPKVQPQVHRYVDYVRTEYGWELTRNAY